MARPPVIPESLLVPMLKLVEEGYNAEKLVVWLQDNHQISVNIAMVNRRIKKVRDIEMQAKRDAIAKRASEQALDYIGMMDDKILKLNKITEDLLLSKDEEKYALARQMLEIQLKYIDKQMNLTGMDKTEEEENDSEAILEGLLDKLGK